jgi:hypothetical protein
VKSVTKSAELIWRLPEAEKRKEKERYEREDIADYGSFSGKYIDISKSDYLGRRKRGYM